MAEHEPLLWRAAIHEAGHVIADHLHGFFPIEAALTTSDGTVGTGRTDCRDRQAVPETAENFIVSCLAGSEAEKAFAGDDSLAVNGGLTDRAKATQVLTACWNHEGDLSAFEARARALVRSDANRRAIERVATELAKEGRLAGRELQLVIEAALGLDGAEPRLSEFRKNADACVLGVLRSQDGTRARAFLTNKLFDALLVGEFSALGDGQAVFVRAQNPDDADRVLAASQERDLVVELLDCSMDVISVRSVSLSDGLVKLEPYWFSE